MKRECESCIKRKTTYCPNSMECMATDDMPYYQNRIMLLEENQELMKLQNNWNELKKYISEQINYYSLDDEDYKEFNVLDSVEQYMQELEGNNE